MLGLQPIFEEIDKKQKILTNSLKYIDNLLSKHKYLCGDELTIADLSAFCEIIEIPIIEVDYTAYKNINHWMQLMQSIPEIQESADYVTEFVGEYLRNHKAKL